jgi:hypothetical protein
MLAARERKTSGGRDRTGAARKCTVCFFYYGLLTTPTVESFASVPLLIWTSLASVGEPKWLR